MTTEKCLWIFMMCTASTHALLCYWCSGVGRDRECEQHPYDVRTGPIYINCPSRFCITAKVTDGKTGEVQSFARLCDNIPRGNHCMRDSRLLTCYESCTQDFCNDGNPGPHYLQTVNYAMGADEDEQRRDNERDHASEGVVFKKLTGRASRGLQKPMIARDAERNSGLKVSPYKRFSQDSQRISQTQKKKSFTRFHSKNQGDKTGKNNYSEEERIELSTHGAHAPRMSKFMPSRTEDGIIENQTPKKNQIPTSPKSPFKPVFNFSRASVKSPRSPFVPRQVRCLPSTKPKRSELIFKVPSVDSKMNVSVLDSVRIPKYMHPKILRKVSHKNLHRNTKSRSPAYLYPNEKFVMEKPSFRHVSVFNLTVSTTVSPHQSLSRALTVLDSGIQITEDEFPGGIHLPPSKNQPSGDVSIGKNSARMLRGNAHVLLDIFNLHDQQKQTYLNTKAASGNADPQLMDDFDEVFALSGFQTKKTGDITTTFRQPLEHMVPLSDAEDTAESPNKRNLPTSSRQGKENGKNSNNLEFLFLRNTYTRNPVHSTTTDSVFLDRNKNIRSFSHSDENKLRAVWSSTFSALLTPFISENSDITTPRYDMTDSAIDHNISTTDLHTSHLQKPTVQFRDSKTDGSRKSSETTENGGRKDTKNFNRRKSTDIFKDYLTEDTNSDFTFINVTRSLTTSHDAILSNTIPSVDISPKNTVNKLTTIVEDASLDRTASSSLQDIFTSSKYEKINPKTVGDDAKNITFTGEINVTRTKTPGTWSSAAAAQESNFKMIQTKHSESPSKKDHGKENMMLHKKSAEDNIYSTIYSDTDFMTTPRVSVPPVNNSSVSMLRTSSLQASTPPPSFVHNSTESIAATKQRLLLVDRSTDIAGHHLGEMDKNRYSLENYTLAGGQMLKFNSKAAAKEINVVTDTVSNRASLARTERGRTAMTPVLLGTEEMSASGTGGRNKSKTKEAPLPASSQQQRSQQETAYSKTTQRERFPDHNTQQSTNSKSLVRMPSHTHVVQPRKPHEEEEQVTSAVTLSLVGQQILDKQGHIHGDNLASNNGHNLRLQSSSWALVIWTVLFVIIY